MPDNVLRLTILGLVKTFGSYRKLAQNLDCDHAYLWKLAHGKKDDPSPELLRKLGLRRVVTVTYQDLESNA